MDNLRKEIGQRIFAIRKKLKLRQEEFGQRIGGKSKAAISKYENGETYPPIDTLIVIADMGGTSLEHLITGKEPESCVDHDGAIPAIAVSEPTEEYSPEIKSLIEITKNNPLIKLMIPGMADLPAELQLKFYELIRDAEIKNREGRQDSRP